MSDQANCRYTIGATAPRPSISVIIPVYNDQRRLKACLESLMAQTCTATYEVIVVDNGSSQSPRAVLPGSAKFRLIDEPHPGSYAARNRGLSTACGDIIAFTDADCIPYPDWLERGLARLLGHPDVGLLAGRIEVYPDDPRAPTIAERYQEVAGFPQSRFVAERHFGATANVFTRKSVIDTVGGFAAHLKSGGDMEWGQRVYRSGFRILYADDVVVRHPARKQVRGLVKQAVRVAGGRRDIRRRSTESALRNAARPLGSLFRSFIALWADPRLPDLRTRLGVVSAGLTIRIAYMAENLRLALGGRPRR